LVPDPLPADSAYIPRVFGFRVHQSGTRAQGNANAAALAAQALRSSNGRRGAVDTFTSQRVVSKSGGGEEGEAAVVQDAKDRTGTEVKVEIKTRKKSVEDGDGEAAQGGDRSKTSNDASSKSNSKKGVTANGDGVVKDEKADGGEGGSNNNSKRKGKEGDNSAVSNNENGGSSKSRSSKRQKRQSGGSEVT
jgi:hypothetical protein